ncbi:hypothetical protein [Fundidesulfovibrio terrae]|uniref:hypothetical protein n=1 Tax=Fundidesulfovibrio terrae TaxID=2922866 RepID=UPI001FB001F6|nr:hypothetical protein [Fundidesulfovibrio terrae]
MPDTPSKLRENDFVCTTPLIHSLITIKCTCGKKFEVSLDDVHLQKTITSRPCCAEPAPLQELKNTIELFSRYVDARAKLGGLGWDVELTALPWCEK